MRKFLIILLIGLIPIAGFTQSEKYIKKRYNIADSLKGFDKTAGGGGGGDFADGGEAGGANRTLGNTDAYSIGLLTNNLERFTIASDGSASFTGNTTMNGYLLFNDPGTDANSFVTQWQADNSTVAQTSSLQTIYGADPYFELKAPDNSGTATSAVKFHDDKTTFLNNISATNFDADTTANTLHIGELTGTLGAGTVVVGDNNLPYAITNSTLVGYQAGFGSGSGGTSNTGVGYLSLSFAADGSNSALGRSAGSYSSGDDGVFVGFESGYASDSDNSTFVGFQSGRYNKAPDNVAVGYQSHYDTGTNNGGKVTLVGFQSGWDAIGDNVTGIGYKALYNNDQDNVIAIGYEAGMSGAVANQLIINQANLNATPIIQGDLSTLDLTFGGNLGIGQAPTYPLDVYVNTPSANDTIFRLGTSDEANRFIVDEDGDVTIAGDLTVDGVIHIHYGEMGNTVDATEVIQSANEAHAMFNANINASLPHLNEGYTFVTGKEGAIASVADNGSGDVRITDVAHGLLTDDIITIQASVGGYTGVHEVIKITDDTFDITGLSYTATSTGTWQMGSYLIVSLAEVKRGVWNASFSQSLNNTQTSIITPYVNTNASTKAKSARLMANNTDVGSIGGNGLMSFTTGDRIWFAVESTSAQTLTFTIRNVTIH